MKAHPAYAAARAAWNAGATLRQRRRRFKDYAYGRQWGDVIHTPEGEWMTEGAYAERSGKKPLSNNMIRQLIKSIIGRFRYTVASDGDKASRGMPDAFADVAAHNLLDELDCRLLEEFLISGCAIQRIVSERRLEPDEAVWVDNVSPERFFVNRYSDPRGSDIRLIGMLHDMTLTEVIMRFGADDPERMRRLRDLFAREAAPAMFPVDAPALGERHTVQFAEAPAGLCRVVEVWRLEPRDLLRCHDSTSADTFFTPVEAAGAIRAVNAARPDGQAIVYSPYTTMRWHAYFFGPEGELLCDYDSPFPHGTHPFAVALYPLTDGEVHPFVEDIIDQQRYINRLISLIDHVMSFAAKGVLLFPNDQKPDDMSWDEVGRLWCTPNAVLPYVSSVGKEPHQAYSTAGVQGASELLGLEMKLFEQISGVSSALSGQQPQSNQSAALYDAQIQNAAISLMDIFDTFNAFRTRRNRRIVTTGNTF